MICGFCNHIVEGAYTLRSESRAPILLMNIPIWQLAQWCARAMSHPSKVNKLSLQVAMARCLVLTHACLASC